MNKYLSSSFELVYEVGSVVSTAKINSKWCRCKALTDRTTGSNWLVFLRKSMGNNSSTYFF